MAGISITLAGNFAKLDELKNKAKSAGDSVKSAFNSNIGKAAFAGISVAATAAFAGVVAAVKSAIDAGGELADMMARTGAEGQGLVIMQRAFENAGMAASEVPAALNRMQKALAGVNEDGEVTNKAFEKLGLSTQDLINLDPVQAFKKIQTAISGINDPARRTAIAMEIFGRSGGQMLAVFQDSTAFAQATAQVGSLGQTLADNAADLDAVGDAFGSLQTKFQQVGAEVAVSLLPQLLEFSKWLNEADFSNVGGGIAILLEKLTSLGDKLADIAEYAPLLIVFQKLADTAFAGEDPERVKAQAGKMADLNYTKGSAPVAEKKRTSASSIPVTVSSGKQQKEKPDTEAADIMAKAKAELAAKEKSKAIAADEYRLERDILAARIKGDAARLAALEREKSIRQEMKQLESAGFTAKEARKPAEQRVDATKAATVAEEKREKKAIQKEAIRATLVGDLQDVQERQRSQQLESSVAKVGSMQRVGGGGGAVGSGLDYARLAADLQREANGLIRQLIAVSQPGPED